ncbi:MAG: NAD(P)/FAD-dependent oxidoreductase [Deltaproteobacteria bacterium]|nr:NAD(P)/FAD-dependent oxidoreductase [Deltaproteobacteria bacterium]
MKTDIVVIGAGISGLVASSLLAKRGFDVVLIEKEPFVGGYVRSFKRDGFIFDAACSFVGGVKEGEELNLIIRELNGEEKIKWLPLRSIRNILPDLSIDLDTWDFEDYIHRLIKLFPLEKASLLSYLKLIEKTGIELKRIRDISIIKRLFFPLFFPKLMKLFRATHGQVLNRFFKDEKLKLALSCLPVTLPPSKLSFLFVATLTSKVIAKGVYYPKGGMKSISEYFEKRLKNFAGKILTSHEVTNISLDKDIFKVKTKNEKTIFSRSVISAINPWQLSKILNYPFGLSLKKLTPSLSAFLVYLGIDSKLLSSDIPSFSYIRSDIGPEEEYRLNLSGNIAKKPTVIVNIPSLLDKKIAPEGKAILRIMTIVPYHYKKGWGEKEKEEIKKRVIDRVKEKLLPSIFDRIELSIVATPLTLERYTYNQDGAIYGLCATPNQIGPKRPSNKTKIDGLFLAGHYTRPAHGIVGAALSGKFAANLAQRWLKR